MSSATDAPTGPVITHPGLAGDVFAALATVRDPELDEPITTLGFVASCTVSPEEGQAQVRLRLPTYYCAPNFSYLMAADAYDAVTSVPGITKAEVILEDHFAADEINAGVATQVGFVASFTGEATSELHDLRAAFLRKAVLAGTHQVCRPLVDAGATPSDLVSLTLGATPRSAELDRLRQRRSDLGLPADDQAPLLLDPVTGQRIPEASVPLHLRKARVTATSIEANASICSGMLKARYPDRDREAS
ncbi:MAG TPA: iron-sulfur cluster assembly protein [Trebonia sp.]|jgi:metal-sulfur cluster biosynthetic enzyme|nr:iron-sulfur cluster assembly protein [Trebonia sp.]